MLRFRNPDPVFSVTENEAGGRVVGELEVLGRLGPRLTVKVHPVKMRKLVDAKIVHR